MSKAYVDTTVLTDALLKPGSQGQAARDALRRYETTELPVYAIKEFKAGPLRTFGWMHDKLALLKSFTKALEALQRMSLTPRRYTTATAIEALTTAASSIGRTTNEELSRKYPRTANVDSILADEFRLAIKTAVFKAWKKRRQVTTDVVNPLTCYKEVAPFEKRGLICLDPIKCDVVVECCMAQELRSRRKDLEKLKKILSGKDEDQPSGNRERQRRYQVIRSLLRKGGEPMTDEMCRNMGDAIFALFAPSDAIILTTNLKDHAPLAKALGKTVEHTVLG
ncbi:MAG: hypothetical protein L0229_32205 [Blastocatellia bacterium]|nr:hypothetical protein [Blastocatellia bacterium]